MISIFTSKILIIFNFGKFDWSVGQNFVQISQNMGSLNINDDNNTDKLDKIKFEFEK